MAKITELPLANLPANTDEFPIVQDGITRRASFAAFTAGMLPLLPEGFQGDPGPAGNVAANLVQLKAAPPGNRTMLWGGVPFQWETADAPYTTDEDQPFVTTVESDHQPASIGAWKRQGAKSISAPDGGNLGDAVMAAETPAVLRQSPRQFPVGATIRTADGFCYKVMSPVVANPHLTTAAGVRLDVIGPLTPDALGAPCNGEDDDAPFWERVWTFTNILTLRSSSTYRLKSLIGLPDNSLFANSAIFLFGWGATIIVSSPLVDGSREAIFTSRAAKVAPNSQADLYSGKVLVSGGNWTQNGTSVLFNGDRIYQLEISAGNYSAIDTIVKSFRPKGDGVYPHGYIQSVRISGGAQFNGVRRLIDGKQAFDISINGIKCTNCVGGVYIDSLTADPAVQRFTWTDVLWQGGGVAIALGKVIGCKISGGYFEANTVGDTATAKCDIWLKKGASPSSSVTIEGVSFQPHKDQIADPNYYPIRIDYQPLSPVAPPPVIDGCWAAGTQIVTPGKAEMRNVGANSVDVMRNAIAPRPATTARRTTIGGSQFFIASSDLSDGKFRIARIDVRHIKLLLLDQQRPTSGNIRVLLQHGTAGGQFVGASMADISFVLMAASEGISPAVALNDVYAGFFLEALREVPSGSPIDTLGGVTRTHFTAPALTFTRTGDFYDLFLSGYAAQPNPNYGFTDRIHSHITIEADARNNSLVISSPIEVA